MNLHTYVTGTIQTRAYRLLRLQVVEVLGSFDPDVLVYAWGDF
jgi:hypothetical protein